MFVLVLKISSVVEYAFFQLEVATFATKVGFVYPVANYYYFLGPLLT